MTLSFRSILHPTDFSELSGEAFAHALRIAVAAQSKLQLLHVLQHATNGALAFPNGLHLLAQWGLTDKDDPPWEVADKLGIEVDEVRIVAQNPTGGIVAFLRQRPCDLIVLATHGRHGFSRWLTGSVAEAVSRRAAIPVLFVAPGARGFVSQISGDTQLHRILVPVDFSPGPGNAIDTVQRFGRLMTGADIPVYFVHVGSSAPPLGCADPAGGRRSPVLLKSGDVVQTIIDTAIEFEVDLIAMPTAAHRDVFDILRGSTTERVIRDAPCPVMALPSP